MSALSLLAVLVLRKNDVRLDFRRLGLDGGILSKILRIGIPSGLQGMVFSFANVIIQKAINSLGPDVMAASSAAFNLEVFAFYFVNAFGAACTSFVGQNYGAGRMDRCRKALKVSLAEDIIFTATVCLVILSGGKLLLRIFTDDPAVIDTGYIRLVWIFSTYIFSLTVEVLSGYLRGFSISLLPALVTIIGVCGVRITWICTVFRMRRTFTSIMQCYPASMAVTALVLVSCALVIRPSRK